VRPYHARLLAAAPPHAFELGARALERVMRFLVPPPLRLGVLLDLGHRRARLGQLRILGCNGGAQRGQLGVRAVQLGVALLLFLRGREGGGGGGEFQSV
jgi:hypothetical protein